MRKTVDCRQNSMSRRRFLGTAAGAGVAAAAGHSLPSLSGPLTEVALAALAADVRILPGLVNDLDGDAEEA